VPGVRNIQGSEPVGLEGQEMIASRSEGRYNGGALEPPLPPTSAPSEVPL
jgi:hypothetical protein